jgi:hypothetical protein
MKHKIVVLTCSWKRPNITKIFIKNLLKVESLLSNMYEFINVVVDSEKSNFNVFKNTNFIYLEHNNLPLSNKWNFGLSYCKNLNFDYLLIMGSDDILTSHILKQYKIFINNSIDFMGITDMYIYDLLKKKFYYWNGYTGARLNDTIGLGRCISKKIIQELDYKLWTDGLNKGLDGSMKIKLDNLKKKINYKSVTVKCKNLNGMAVDIKGGLNITDLNKFKNLKEIPQNYNNYKIIKKITS